MSRIDTLLEDRKRRRLEAGHAALARILAALEAAGYEAYPFGSMVTGKVHEASDVDVLVAGDADILTVFRLAENAAQGFPFDIVTWEDVDPDSRPFIMETMRASDLRALQERSGQD